MIQKQSPSRTFAVLFVVAGIIGFAASLLLTVDKMRILQNPGYIPPCNINPFISCGSVMATAQAEVLGFPNSFIGIAFFAMIATVGFALLSGAQFKKWFWLGLQGVTALSAVFVYWLAFESVYRIGSLCPYCMVVWAVTIPLALYVKLHNLNAGYLPVSKSVAVWSVKYHWIWLVALYLIIAIPILVEFWPYWSGLFA